MNHVINAVNILLSTAMWFVVARLLVGLIVRNEANPLRLLLHLVTDPAYRVSRWLTAARLPEPWLGPVSLFWLLLARILVTRLYAFPPP